MLYLSLLPKKDTDWEDKEFDVNTSFKASDSNKLAAASTRGNPSTRLSGRHILEDGDFYTHLHANIKSPS
jgi:hypothetical protein